MIVEQWKQNKIKFITIKMKMKFMKLKNVILQM